MDDGFYRAFEDRYRGSRELITRRLEAYLPFLAPLKEAYEDYPVLDLGCGRGEWLELLIREGYAPSGVDLDDGMLQACESLGLPARHADALLALQELPDNSLVAVTGFHIAEHVPFPVLQQLVAEALRVLRPAGLLILETPNAESLVVGTNSFYLDPTHERPLPNLLLSFLTEHSGFARSKIVRLQEEASLRDENHTPGLWEVLSGTSPDYAVVAQKQAQSEVLGDFDTVFEAAYGVSLDQLAIRYDRALEQRLSLIEEEVATGRTEYMTHEQFQKTVDEVHRQQTEQLSLLQERYEQFQQTMDGIHNHQTDQLLLMQDRYSADVQALRTENAVLQQQCFDLQRHCSDLQHNHQDALLHAETIQSELNASLGNAHHWYLRATAYEQQLAAMRCSTSWRITAPLRFVANAVYWPIRSGKSTLSQGLRRSIPHARLWLARRPAIQRPVIAVLNRSPWLLAKLRSLHQSNLVPEDTVNDPQHAVIDHAPLTQRGRMIESALREAMMKGQN